MKQPALLATVLALSLAGCASRGVSVKTSAPPRQPTLESGGIARGKLEAWRAPVTVENLQGFDQEMFADLQRNFIEPLARGPYRYAIDSITLAAVPEVDREWTLLMALDTGAAIRVENFVAWDEIRQTYFYDGLHRALAGLEKARRADPVLNRYVRHWSNPRNVPPPEWVAQAPESSRLED